MASEKNMKFGAYAEQPLTYLTASGAVPVAEGTYVLNGAAALALTLALPTTVNKQNALIQDGTKMKFVSTSAYAHTITTPALGINGADDTVTFGGAVGNYVELTAINGKWIVTASSGATLSEV